MTEIFRPDLGITGGGRFFYRYEAQEVSERLAPMREALKASNLTPRLIRRQESTAYPGDDLLIYERVIGYDLMSLPSHLHETSFRNSFAKRIAQVFVDLRDGGYVQEDSHAGNFMLEENTGKIFVVDDVEIHPIKPSENLMPRFANVLLGMYLQEAPFHIILQLNRTGELQTRLVNLDRQGLFVSPPDANRQEAEAILRILKERGLADKLDPKLLEIIHDALIPGENLASFDRIFALDDDS